MAATVVRYHRHCRRCRIQALAGAKRTSASVCGREQGRGCARHRHQLVDEGLRRGDRVRLSGERDLVAAHVHVDTGVLLLDDAQESVLRSEELHHRDAVGVDALDDLGGVGPGLGSVSHPGSLR